MKIVKEIYGQILRHLILKIKDKEIKESIKKNEEKLTLKFNTCLVLMKDIEHVVKNTTNTWKNVYLLHKLSDFIVSISDKDDEDNQETIDYEEEQSKRLPRKEHRMMRKLI